MTRSLALRAAVVSLIIFALFVVAWHLATMAGGTAPAPRCRAWRR